MEYHRSRYWRRYSLIFRKAQFARAHHFLVSSLKTKNRLFRRNIYESLSELEQIRAIMSDRKEDRDCHLRNSIDAARERLRLISHCDLSFGSLLGCTILIGDRNAVREMISEFKKRTGFDEDNIATWKWMYRNGLSLSVAYHLSLCYLVLENIELAEKIYLKIDREFHLTHESFLNLFLKPFGCKPTGTMLAHSTAPYDNRNQPFIRM